MSRERRQVEWDRAAGALMHITSLPGGAGCGDIGPEAHAFAERLGRAGARWWQMLPVGPIGKNFAPYAARSSFSGGAHLVSLTPLIESGRLDSTGVVEGSNDFSLELVREKERALRAAARRFFGVSTGKDRAGFDAFCERADGWLADDALFEALARAEGTRDWTAWPAPIRLRETGAMREARDALRDEINEERFIQFEFDCQWRALRDRCAASGVRLLGDVPFYPALHSADVWANRRLFELTEDGRPPAVAGVPPDYFSESGQIWECPLYEWEAHRRERFAWWAARMKRALELFDAVRIDHFIGLTRSWRISADAPDARQGAWLDGPGSELLDAIFDASPDAQLIAEDLGLVTDAVTSLRRRHGLPGMRVLQFAFDDDDPSNPHRPANHERNGVVYSGTHDNNTLRGWIDECERRDELRIKLQRACAAFNAPLHDLFGAMLDGVFSSVAHTAVIPIQDALGLGAAARMNIPGAQAGAWRWRVQRAEDLDRGMERLGALIARSGR